MLFTDVRLAMPDGPSVGWLRTAADRIAAVGVGEAPRDQADARTIDGAGRTLMPGFIDVHVHGALGNDVMDASPAGLQEMSRFHARHGVTSFLPTTLSASDADIRAALGAAAEAMAQPRDSAGARIAGVHLEGPYISAAMRGAQDPAHISTATPAEAIPYLDTGLVRLVTLAPEIEENVWLVEECVRRGITVSAGHTNATYDELVEAVDRGVTHITHTYNAMRGMHHREPGALGAALTLPGLRRELIADNLHVHPAAMQVLFGLCGTEGTVLVTDAVRAAGLEDGEHRLDRRTVRLREGAVRLRSGALAGSVLTMDRALRNFSAAVGVDPALLWRTTSGNAARSAGVADRKGSLRVGQDADLVLLDDAFEVVATIVEGEVAYVEEAIGRTQPLHRIPPSA